jgi:hypothetical protein
MSFLHINTFSQDDILILHPCIGDTIDNIEKNKYLLFPEINDTLFRYAFIKHIGNEYLLYANLKNSNHEFVKQLDSLEIQLYAINIAKLNEYYSSLQNTQNDSLELERLMILIPTQKILK